MPLFRKKPVVIEAFKVSDILDAAWNNIEALPSCIVEAYSQLRFRPAGIEIPTLEGTMLALPSDWLIRGVNGELYPCKPDIFEKTHEPVTE